MCVRDCECDVASFWNTHLGTWKVRTCHRHVTERCDWARCSGSTLPFCFTQRGRKDYFIANVTYCRERKGSKDSSPERCKGLAVVWALWTEGHQGCPSLPTSSFYPSSAWATPASQLTAKISWINSWNQVCLLIGWHGYGYYTPPQLYPDHHIFNRCLTNTKKHRPYRCLTCSQVYKKPSSK